MASHPTNRPENDEGSLKASLALLICRHHLVSNETVIPSHARSPKHRSQISLLPYVAMLLQQKLPSTQKLRSSHSFCQNTLSSHLASQSTYGVPEATPAVTSVAHAARIFKLSDLKLYASQDHWEMPQPYTGKAFSLIRSK
jgi:hypothetical protein